MGHPNNRSQARSAYSIPFYGQLSRLILGSWDHSSLDFWLILAPSIILSLSYPYPYTTKLTSIPDVLQNQVNVDGWIENARRLVAFCPPVPGNGSQSPVANFISACLEELWGAYHLCTVIFTGHCPLH